MSASGEAFVGVLACARAADGNYPEAERDLFTLFAVTIRLPVILGSKRMSGPSQRPSIGYRPLAGKLRLLNI